jgi:ADP-ribosyl-[dinitrogen reductase] hydrolase
MIDIPHSLICRAKGALLGLAVGDAVGTSVEFQARYSFPEVTDMTGGGPFNLDKGKWTDDTSMAICLAESLIECTEFDAVDQLTRYCDWRDNGVNSATDICFDIGNTTWWGLTNFRETGDPYSSKSGDNDAGNGSIMRLAPIAIKYYDSPDVLYTHAINSSRTTHGAQECLDACVILADIIARLVSGMSKYSALEYNYNSDRLHEVVASPKLRELMKLGFLDKSYEEIKGTGYVVDSLEASIWCFMHTNSFEAAILKAVNLGDDADTTAAITGQIAGAYYGMERIPEHWLAPLYRKDDIEELAAKLMDAAH